MRFANIVIGIVIFLVIVVPIVFGIFGDYLWFSTVGYQPVFLKILLTSVEIGIAAFVAFFAFSFIAIKLSARAAKGRKKAGSNTNSMNMTIKLITVIIGIIMAFAMASQWEVVLKYQNYTPFGASDPVFGQNIGFYAFTLPFYSTVLNFLLATFILSAVLAVISYISQSLGFRMENVEQDEEKEQPEFFFGPFNRSFGGGSKKQMKMNWSGSWERFVPIISVLLFLIFVIIAGQIWLAQYGLLYAPGGAVYGAGYTDVNITLPLLNILSIVAVVIGILFLANIRIKKARFIRDGIAAFFIIAVLGIIISGVVQALVVRPNELNLEHPFIERNIQATLFAYGLDSIEETIFPVSYNLTQQDIQNNPGTIGNIRIWDWRPLKQTYQQLQLFRTYYDFNDLDIDRYIIDGNLKQTMMSAREMNPSGLSRQAQTWVNQHLVYTHGYGVVMNPVDQVSTEGLPVFLMKDIPVTSDYIELEQPRLYYSENANDYVITGADTDEFDYPSGDQNIYTPYAGTGGVQLSDTLRRLVYAIKFRSVELLVSGSIKPESKLLMNREISKRIYTIAPFLAYDDDPYIVVADNKMYWMIDAYTITDTYPYSQPTNYYSRNLEGFNYMRNSVKVVVDAYNGDVRFYVIDDSDPIIQTYQKIFHGLFMPFNDMPDNLKSHVRYPEDLFDIQAAIYSTYHMKDPRVFYNKEDTWVIPDEIHRGSRQKMIPYYVIMKLPDSDTEEFILMIPFTPKGKQNMVGWMAARSDQSNYGKLVVYQFSKQELTYGPMQIEARIDQDPDISQLITLWSQAGSDVLRGNTLVIPIEDSILYVEPLYLEATEEGTLPQLQRVIVSFGDRLTMQDTLDEALDELFGSGTSTPDQPDGEPGEPGIELPEGAEERLAEIARIFQFAQDALADGDLGLYQQYIDQIGELAGS